jgi:hemolysin III
MDIALYHKRLSSFRDGGERMGSVGGGCGGEERRERCRVNGYTWAEEAVNALTHGIGLVAAAVAVPVLMVMAVSSADAWRVAGAAVYGATLLLLYAVSTAYHAVRDARRKALLRLCDHCAVYLLIAGTYTPFMLALRGGWGWALLTAVWALGVLGIVYKVFLLDRFPRLSTALYLAMGWLIVVAAAPLVRLLGPGTAAWLAIGGLAYTAGLAFYHSRREYAHAVWHVFVLAGSLCHGVAVALHLGV